MSCKFGDIYCIFCLELFLWSIDDLVVVEKYARN